MAHAAWFGGYTPSPRASWRERRVATLRALPTFVLAVVVVGGLYIGAFTPTEASAVGFAGSLILTGPLLRRLDWKTLVAAVRDSMATTVTIFLILVGAKLFGKAITLYRLPQDLSALLIQTFDTPAAFVAIAAIVLLLMGCFLEALSMLLLMMPVLYPALLPLGIDPIWFGVFFVVMIECALITPPVGLNLFVIQAVARTSVADVALGVWPFIVIMLGTAVTLYLLPDIVLYIPFKM